jgi:serine/threonine protein kinase
MKTPKRFESKARAYNVTSRLPDGETYDLYLAEVEGDAKKRPVLVKIAGDRGLNCYAEQEAKVLGHLNNELTEASRPVRLLIPELLDTLTHGECAGLVTDYAQGYWTLPEIRSVYTDGVPPDHVAWIFNRLTQAIITAHMSGVVHGKILPHHLVVRSGDKNDDMRHTAVLTDWTCAVIQTEPGKWPPLSAMSEGHDEYYPHEVMLRQSVSPATDLAMAAGCAIYLLGGDARTGEVPKTTPWAMAQLLRNCREKNQAQRPRSLTDFYDQFQAMLAREFGPPKFVELPLPQQKPKDMGHGH